MVRSWKCVNKSNNLFIFSFIDHFIFYINYCRRVIAGKPCAARPGAPPRKRDESATSPRRIGVAPCISGCISDRIPGRTFYASLLTHGNFYMDTHMTGVLSIQMRAVGHKTYAKLIRDTSDYETDVHVDSFWVDDERSAMTKVVRKVAEFRVPQLNRRNLDFRRARAEWATGNMGSKLARRKTHLKDYDVLHFHTQTAAFGSVNLMKSIPTVITIDMTAFQLMREHGSGPEWTYRPNVLMERNVFEHAAHIVAFSDWARDSVIDEHGIAPERVSVITPGVLKEAFHPPQFESGSVSKPKILF